MTRGSVSDGHTRRCGLIVNPIAGMGGCVGLKGTDGPIILAEARRRGAEPHSGERAGRALRRLHAACPDLELVTAPGAMGGDIAAAAGIDALLVDGPPERPGGVTTAADTRALAGALSRLGIDLILVAGGDGTVRDVFGVVGDWFPILGIPTGVKMHSAVFATSPEAAGDLAAHLLNGDRRARLGDAEIMDIDEDAARADRVSAHLYGYARTPFERALLQGAKAGAQMSDEAAMAASAREIAETMEPGTIYILGPGTTMRMIRQALGLEGTLLGVDAVRDGALIGRDLAEADILDLVQGCPAKIVVGVIGGQGCLFGRGNQQISAAVIRAIGRDNIIVVAGMTKLAALSPERLFVDTGAADVDASLAGYMAVHTGPGRTAMMRVG